MATASASDIADTNKKLLTNKAAKKQLLLNNKKISTYSGNFYSQA